MVFKLKGLLILCWGFFKNVDFWVLSLFFLWDFWGFGFLVELGEYLGVGSRNVEYRSLYLGEYYIFGVFKYGFFGFIYRGFDLIGLRWDFRIYFFNEFLGEVVGLGIIFWGV